jgi:hypothetical protein
MLAPSRKALRSSDRNSEKNKHCSTPSLLLNKLYVPSLWYIVAEGESMLCFPPITLREDLEIDELVTHHAFLNGGRRKCTLLYAL